MIAVLALEARRARDLRWWSVVPIVGGVLAGLAVSARASAAGVGPADWDLVLAHASLTHQVAAIAGVLAVVGDWRHRSMATVVRAAPTRAAVADAKVVVGLVVGAAVGLLAAVVGTVATAASVGLGDAGVGAVVGFGGRLVVADALLGAVAAGVALVVHDAVAAVAVAVVVPAVTAPVAATIGGGSDRWSPYGAASELSGPLAEARPLTGFVVLLAWVAVAAAVGRWRLDRRDL